MRAKTLEARFKKFTKVVNGCWEWTGSISKPGYGRISKNGKPELAHRVSFEFHKHKIPKGMYIDHICRNTKCLNPEHLRCVTPKQNAIENSKGQAYVNSKKTHCPYGHAYAGDNVFVRKGKASFNQRGCRACSKRRNHEIALKFKDKNKGNCIVCDTPFTSYYKNKTCSHKCRLVLYRKPRNKKEK